MQPLVTMLNSLINFLLGSAICLICGGFFAILVFTAAFIVTIFGEKE